jgi:hypothetical protein
MEDYGFLAAAHANPGVDALVVRGISDLVDNKQTTDEAGWQERAAWNAAAFAFEILAKFGSTLVKKQQTLANNQTARASDSVSMQCKGILQKIISQEKQNTNGLIIDLESDCSDAEQYFVLTFILPEIARLNSSMLTVAVLDRNTRIYQVAYRLLDHESFDRRSWPLFLDLIEKNPHKYLTAKFFEKYHRTIECLEDEELTRFTKVLNKAWVSFFGDYDIENALAKVTETCWDAFDAKQKEAVLRIFFKIVADRDRKDHYPQKQVAKRIIELLDRENRDALLTQVFAWIRERVVDEYRERTKSAARDKRYAVTLDERTEYLAHSSENLRELLEIKPGKWEKTIFGIYQDVWSR